MTRVKISGAILLLLIGVSIFSGVWVNRRCDALLSEINVINDLEESGNTSGAAEKARQMNADWENFREKASVLLKYDKLVEIDRLCSRIVYLTENEETEMTAELAELHHMLEMLKSGETPLWNSVF
ncbi:DUF4363 family protein [Ruminococcus sp.]|uniref:DUF4363 family protein n=1 Tax=Ruminococcus sp. TaxID=41978 RepID=UPI0025DCB653|nr:DUF4363 family protein [Ruminococcus sp.]MCR4639451.1 DUF4363 family protein [Ruminococcus sp.]